MLNLPWQPIQSLLDPLFNDSDRQAEKLPLWLAECKWQGWFMAVCNHVTERPQRCWAGETTAHIQGDICTQHKYLTKGLWSHDLFVKISDLYSTSKTQVQKHLLLNMHIVPHPVKTDTKQSCGMLKQREKKPTVSPHLLKKPRPKKNCQMWGTSGQSYLMVQTHYWWEKLKLLMDQ